MKFLTVFAAILAVACARSTWTPQQLSDALLDPHTDASLKPHLESALNSIMDALWNGQQIEAVTVTVPSVDVSGMTLHELSLAIQDPATDPALLPHLEQALNELMEAMFEGAPVAVAIQPTPAMEVHYYTLHEISSALQDPATNPELVPYFEHALNELMESIFSGQNVDGIIVVVPAGIDLVVPVEVIPAPVEEAAPETPEIPSLPESPASPVLPASPLVQIIVNINQKEVSSIPAAPVVLPSEPVHVVDSSPVEVPAHPVQVVDNAPIDQVQIIDSPVDQVQIVDAPVDHVQIIDEPVEENVQIIEDEAVEENVQIIVDEPVEENVQIIDDEAVEENVQIIV